MKRRPGAAFLLAEACLALVLTASMAMGVVAERLARRAASARLARRSAALYLADGLAREEGRRYVRTGLAGFGPAAMDQVDSVLADLAALATEAVPLRPPPLRLRVALHGKTWACPAVRAVVSWKEGGRRRRARSAVLVEASRGQVRP